MHANGTPVAVIACPVTRVYPGGPVVSAYQLVRRYLGTCIFWPSASAGVWAMAMGNRRILGTRNVRLLSLTRCNLCNLVLLTEVLLLALALGGLGGYLLVVLLESSEVLTGFGELTLLHTLTDVPVDEGTLGVHEVELVVDAGEDL